MTTFAWLIAAIELAGLVAMMKRSGTYDVDEFIGRCSFAEFLSARNHVLKFMALMSVGAIAYFLPWPR